MTGSEKKPVWQDRVWQFLEKEGTAWGRAANSKTINYTVGGRRVPISSRQYVLFTTPDDAHVESVTERLGVAWGANARIGFWVPNAWKDVRMLVLEGRAEGDGVPPSFDVRGMLEMRDRDQADSARRYDVVTDARAVYEQVCPYLTVEDCSRPPVPVAPRGADARGRADPGALLASAEALWATRLGKDVAAATVGCFALKFPAFKPEPARARLERLTRLTGVVEKDDWCKLAVFGAPAWDRADSLLADRSELDAVDALPWVRFALMTNVDNDRVDLADGRLALIPAFRLWRYAFYLLQVARAGTRHRFYLARHPAGAPWLYAYDPVRDRLALGPAPPALAPRHFYYIVPHSPDQLPRVPVFGSLAELGARLQPTPAVLTSAW